jgi:hypothetical protein
MVVSIGYIGVVEISLLIIGTYYITNKISLLRSQTAMNCCVYVLAAVGLLSVLSAQGIFVQLITSGVIKMLFVILLMLNVIGISIFVGYKLG